MKNIREAIISAVSTYKVGDIIEVSEIGPAIKALYRQADYQNVYDGLNDLTQLGYLEKVGDWEWKYVKEVSLPKEERPAPQKEIFTREEVIALLMEARTSNDARQVSRIQGRLRVALGDRNFDSDFMEWRKKGWYGGASAFADHLLRK